jgi:methyl-accepting chemotaxis protein PixJ
MVNRIRSVNTNNHQGQAHFSPPETITSNGASHNGRNGSYPAEANGKENGFSTPAASVEQQAAPHLSGDPFFDSLLTKQGGTLRRQLATTILPSVLVPLGVVGVASQMLTNQGNQQQAAKELQNQAIATGQATHNLVTDAKTIATVIAPESSVVEFSKDASKEAEANGLNRGSGSEVEQLVAAKPLRLDPKLNDYLKRTAEAAQLAELMVAEQHGITIASNGSSRLVNRDEAWWKQVSQKGRAIEVATDASGNVTGIHIAQAVTDPGSGRFIGAVKGQIATSQFESALNTLRGRISGSQQVQILGVSDTGVKSISTLSANGSGTAPVIMGGDAVAQKATSLVNQQNNNGSTSGSDLKVESFNYSQNGRGLITSFVQDGRQYSLATIPDTNWVIVASAAQGELGTTPQNWALIFASLFLILGGAATAAIYFTSRRLSLPLSELSNALEQAATGNMEVYTRPRGSSETQKLATHFNSLVARLRTMLTAQTEALNQAQFFADLAHSASIGDNQTVFDLAVQAAKKHLSVDRVVIYGFEPDWSGSIVAEAVNPGWPKALRDKITDPCIPREILEEYRKGRCVPTSDVHKTNYSPAHIQLLDRLSVRANLVVPVVSSNRLLGLFVAHQCSGTRVWQQSDINYMRELSAQVGLALTGSTLATQSTADAERARLIKDATLRILRSLDMETILQVSVEEVRRALKTDRVVIYRFHSDFKSGVIVAESVDQRWVRAMGQTLYDPLAEGAIERYKSGRIWHIDNIEEADLHHCHCELLERLQVKANIVAPIITRGKLYGLLAAHQCGRPRIWDDETDLFAQLATQIGAAMDQANLLKQQEEAAERAQQLNDITLRMRESLNREQIFKAVVDGLQDAIRVERAIVYLFDKNWKGTVVSEAITRGFPSALDARIDDPCFAESYIEKYRKGRVQALSDIYAADLDKCYLSQLEPFQVKANIVAPILVNTELLGLLVVHQCSAPRNWQDAEIELLRQVAIQLGFALEQATLLKQQQEAAQSERQLNEIVFHMRESLDRQQVHNAVVRGLREALEVDRAIVYLFDKNWKGTVVAESVKQGFPAALEARIDDPCFALSYVEKYRRGRVQALSNIYEAGLDKCYLSQLEPFQVKANIVAPIVIKEELLGLLVVHQCSGPRNWRQIEIDFMRQIALQFGFALEQVTLMQKQQATAASERQLNDIILRMRESLDRQQVYTAVVRGLREALRVDRAIVYLFDENWKGSVVAESVKQGYPAALEAKIDDPCFALSFVEKYRRGRVQALPNIHEAGLDKCYLSQLAPFEVKANIVAPIVIQENLLGLLVVHQCSGPRNWQETETDFMRQVAVQLGFALEQVNLFEQREQARLKAESLSEEQRLQNRALQEQLVQLLGDVEGAASGDLTVHAEVTAGEIGTVADFFNSIIESLRHIVTQVKQSAVQVNSSVGENEEAIRHLAEEALRQAEETTHALDSVEQMTLSIQTVADSARRAAEVARAASRTAETGGSAMDLTVQNILNLRETVGETAKKVKRLGESSQQISKVISLINQIALQTNLLAINAGIEAARAGEQGQGFAVVAEEVGELAARSAAATQEIEQIVETIQRETSEVVEAMELGTTQVVEGTRLVADAKQSLGQIVEVSRQIDELVQSISSATVSQVQTSQSITELMHEIAEVSERTSDSSLQVSSALRRTAEITRELQSSVGMFKVGSEA